MNWKILALAFLTVKTVYSMVLHTLQYRSANNPTPANVADIYDAETYLSWKRYHGEKSRLDIAATLVSYLLMVVLLCTNAYASYAALFPSGIYVQMFAVLLLQCAVETQVDCFFGYVNTMVIEQKYGFNRTTLKTFLTDQVRDFFIGLLLSVVLMAALAGLHTALGNWVVAVFTGLIFCLSLAISFLYPLLSRMGNKFVPLEEGELKDKLMGLLTKHGYRVKAIEVMDASRRTTKLNAYFTGYGKLKTIVLYDNLLTAMSTDEICAVFAHELGHGLHKDVPKMQAMNLGNMLLMALVVWLTVREPQMHTAFGFSQVNYGFSYILLNIGLGMIQPLTGMLINAYSRRAEFRADQQAVNEGYGPALVTGLKKLARENFAHLSPSPVQVVLEYSHPSLSQRIAAVENKEG